MLPSLQNLVLLAAAFLPVPALAQVPSPAPAAADPVTYLADLSALCRVDWPKNRTVNVVCHGHSVPAGYFKTPEIHLLEAYPHLLRAGLAERFPHAMINVIVTAIGGEMSESGARRFEADVLSHRPDLITIDYALNDRRIGLVRARAAWVAMIQAAQAKGIKVILFTPTPDLATKLDSAEDPLNQHAEQIRQLASEYHLGLVDSLAAFQEFAKGGGEISTLMAQPNHPNAMGHELVGKALLAWFPAGK